MRKGQQQQQKQDNLIKYTVKCGYRGIEDLDSVYAKIIPGRFPGEPDRISCPCKGCGGRAEEVVSIGELTPLEKK